MQRHNLCGKLAHVERDPRSKFGDPADPAVRTIPIGGCCCAPHRSRWAALILGAKSEARAFSALPNEAFAELARVTREIETVLRRFVNYERINYLMLMMVDPHVHFHVMPRYQGNRSDFGALSFPITDGRDRRTSPRP